MQITFTISLDLRFEHSFSKNRFGNRLLLLPPKHLCLSYLCRCLSISCRVYSWEPSFIDVLPLSSQNNTWWWHSGQGHLCTFPMWLLGSFSSCLGARAETLVAFWSLLSFTSHFLGPVLMLFPLWGGSAPVAPASTNWTCCSCEYWVSCESD